MDTDFGVNQGLVEELYLRFRDNPASVDPAWRVFFEQLDATYSTQAGLMIAPVAIVPSAPRGNGNGNGGQIVVAPVSPTTLDGYPSPARGTMRPSLPPTPEVHEAHELQGRVSALVNAFRARGHLFAKLDPLGLAKLPAEELTLEAFGLDDVDPETSFSAGDIPGPAKLSLREIVSRLQETYTRSIGVEFTYIEDLAERRWLQQRMEGSFNRAELGKEEQIRILSKLTDAELFETFLHKSYVGAKRFSVEGGESVIPMMDLLIDYAARDGVEEIVIGMAHRGRLNVLANIMGKSVREIFAHFEDANPEAYLGRGDVKYHLGYSSDRTVSSGQTVHLSLAFNPSHLEFVNPVVTGRVRAKQERKHDDARKKVLPLLIHGDAAFIGQGVVAETLNLQSLRGYDVGGTVHVVINNQIGFTTDVENSRSTHYSTDITRMLRCPVFHVNGEDPEAVVQVVRLATEYRQKYAKDCVIDMYCYRKYGHNETDEPRYTQPVMYAAIDRKPTVREIYVERLVEMGKLDRSQADQIAAQRAKALDDAFAEVKAEIKKGPVVLNDYAMGGVWQGYQGGADSEVAEAKTAVPLERLRELVHAITTIPGDFNANKGVLRTVIDKRRKSSDAGAHIDWGTAEHLAFASLCADGTPVRITGQDARRGTFSHRHAVLMDSEKGNTYTPLAHLAEHVSGVATQGKFEVWDSPLSEQGVLGFEYGYSLDYPEALVIWEAQFGDFANGAQVIIDQFLVSGEDKWKRLSGLVLLLPHGFEGQGPEHSSARLERFLALSAEDNIQVCNLTTPAQIFHALRRQVVRPWRKPLVVMSPKSLLRLPQASSTLDDLATGTFQRIIPDQSGTDPKKVRRVLLCSGKVYYDLDGERQKRKSEDVHIVRIEQLYPLRAEQIKEVLAPYGKKTELVWVQEEPWNNGAWYFMNARLSQWLDGRAVKCVARAESASPATGSHKAHKLEQELILKQAFE